MTQLYKDFRPTQFDSAGLALDSQQDWLVLTVTRTRDSEALEQSNFRTALEILGGESDTCEVHRFGHWGPGWFEIILLHPDRAQEADEIEGALAHYPILSDDDHSELEAEETMSSWEHGAQQHWARTLGREYALADTTVDFLESAESSATLAWHEAHQNEYNRPYDVRYLESATEAPSREEVARLIRSLRGGSR